MVVDDDEPAAGEDDDPDVDAAAAAPEEDKTNFAEFSRVSVVASRGLIKRRCLRLSYFFLFF